MKVINLMEDTIGEVKVPGQFGKLVNFHHCNSMNRNYTGEAADGQSWQQFPPVVRDSICRS